MRQGEKACNAWADFSKIIHFQPVGISSVSLAADSSFCGRSLFSLVRLRRGKGQLRRSSQRRNPHLSMKKDGSSPSFLHALVSHTPQGRGGSVSRRDHNQLAGNRTQLSGGTISAEAATSNASRSSGGSAREGLLSEKPPPSHTHVFLRTRESRRRRTFRCSACSHEPCRSGGRSGALPPKEHPQNPDE